MKSKLRKELIKIRENIEEKCEKSEKIAEKILLLPDVKTAQTIMVFLSFRSEVNTGILVKKLLDMNKSLCAPVCQNDGIMVAKRFTSTDELVTGAYGIKEPDGEDVSDIDLVIVPGLAFNERFHRIGYGKGYYDRFLENFKGVSVGLFFDEQMTDFLEEPHDLPLDYIITPTKPSLNQGILLG